VMGREDDALARRAAREARRAAMHTRETEPESESANDGDGAVDPVRAARDAARAAAVGAAVGAVRALTTRRSEAAAEEEEDTLPADEAEPETEQEPEPQREPEPEREPERQAEAPPRQSRRDASPREGVDFGTVERAIQSAREQLRELFGAEPESVSSFGRTRDGWRVTLEVVEVRRIPETTDVLASYEVELDENGDLIAFERVRRYQRSEALDGSGS